MKNVWKVNFEKHTITQKNYFKCMETLFSATYTVTEEKNTYIKSKKIQWLPSKTGVIEMSATNQKKLEAEWMTYHGC